VSTTTTEDIGREPTPQAPDHAPPGLGVRVLLASLLGSAAAIHLVLVPTHAELSNVDAVAFAVAGWAQLCLAVAVAAWPTRSVLKAAVGVSLLTLGAWIVSRTVGLPFGSHAGTAEDVDALGLFTAGVEAGALVLAGLALARPGLGAKASNETLTFGSLVPLALLVATTVVIASPDTRTHAHDDEGEAVAAELASVGADRCDLGFNAAAYWRETDLAGLDTVTGGMLADRTAASAAGHDDGHDHGSGPAPVAASTATTLPDPTEGRGSKELDHVIAQSQGEGELGAAAAVVALAEVSDETYDMWLQRLHLLGGHDHGSGAPDDNGGHGGHLGPQPWIAMTDQAQCDTLATELERAREIAMSTPTAADAEAAGYRMVTPYVPGIAAHWMKFDYVDEEFHLEEPEMLLYDGNGLEAGIVGLSYYVLQSGEVEPSQGFTGPNDHFHRHVGLCMRNGVTIGDSTTTKEECEALGGRKNDGSRGWMNHVWVVPGCESPWGMFSGANPLLDSALAENSGSNQGCDGSAVFDRFDLSPGDATNSPTTVTGASQEQAAG
jgi:hypothetical protein